MSSDEEDYMSDAFLQKCGDTRPGLAPKHVQRQFEKEKHQQQANKNNVTIPKQKLEVTQREAGLKVSISSDSKGFALLQKMGYKPGMGIGKEGTGRVEPIPIEVKSGRSGLGRETEMKRKATEMNNMRAAMAAKRQKADEKRSKTFLDRMSDRFTERSAERDLRTAQKACLQLDQEQGLTEPGEPFFWPSNSLPSQKESDDDGGEEEPEVMKGYVRSVKTDDQDSDSEVEDDDDVTETPAYLEFSEAERLEILTRYLRNFYHYCIWCGTKYDDQKDLETNCPGNSAAAHD